MSATSPIAHQVLLGCSPQDARSAWTDHLGEWWPLATHSVHGPDAALQVLDGAITETVAGHPPAPWGQISSDTDGDLHVSWRAGVSEAEATWFWLTFAPTATEGTCLLRLQHGGWERRSDEMRGQYRRGWPVVLDALSDWVGVPDSRAATAEYWLLLEHTPGRTVGPEGVFASPDFQHHPDHLRALHQRGLVVAAGPLADGSGEGTTVLRLPDFAVAQAEIRAAQVDDLSVAAELLDVRVRPWRVVVHA